jgi:FdhD protein
MTDQPLGGEVELEVLRIEDGVATPQRQAVATEVPCTIVVNGQEVVTALLTPTFLEEFAVGHLFTAGVINSAAEVTACRCDETKWRLDVETPRAIDLALLGKRLYTSGCGKGVMYASVAELSARRPLAAGPAVASAKLVACMRWLLSSSSLFRRTHGLHSAALSAGGELPALLIDDIGRHNAADKVIGHGLRAGADFSTGVLLGTGRTSSEILHKAKRAGIPIVLSKGAPTHQTVLLAREMGMTVASFGSAGRITVFAGAERITTDR